MNIKGQKVILEILLKSLRFRNKTNINLIQTKLTNMAAGKGKGGRGKVADGAAKAVSKSAKAGLQFPVGRIARFMKVGRFA